jgi:hypothetical protein
MNQKKKARRARGLGSDSGLDLAISRFTNSLAFWYHFTMQTLHTTLLPNICALSGLFPVRKRKKPVAGSF